ncbi:MAG: hypothetical protein QG597_2163 [Actinomycetota bacterium]|nr:hypothetical protein [Actinomycetota bacterium]
MLEFFRREIVVSGRLSLFLALTAFVVTFMVTRTITRSIRAGKGPVKNVTSGDLHIHHVVPGVIALLIGGVLLMAAARVSLWHGVGAVLFGLGAALVLDEFALILHLDDVYWKPEGSLSVDAITVAMTVMAAALIVAAPDNPPGPDRADPHLRAVMPALFVAFWILPTAVTVLKGRLFLAALAVLNPVFGWWGSLRLARPGSPWAALRYHDHPNKMIRARARAAAADARTAPLRRWWSEHIFGLERFDARTPADQPDPVTAESAEPGPRLGPSN